MDKQSTADPSIHSLIVHQAVLDVIHAAKGMLPVKVYEDPDRTCVWALDKLGLKEEQWPQMHSEEALSDNHQIVHCKVR